MSTFTDVECKIVPRTTADGHPFSEILYTFKEDGVERHVLTRLFHPLTDSAYTRAQEVANFKRRQARPIAV